MDNKFDSLSDIIVHLLKEQSELIENSLEEIDKRCSILDNTKNYHIPEEWDNDLVELQDIRFDAINAAKNAWFYARILGTFDKIDDTTMLYNICRVLGIDPDNPTMSIRSMALAAFVQESFNCFERENFLPSGLNFTISEEGGVNVKRYNINKSRYTRELAYEEYNNIKKCLNEDNLKDSCEAFKHWLTFKLSNLAKIFGFALINNDKIKRSLGYIWAFQRIFHAFVVTPTLIYCPPGHDIDNSEYIELDKNQNFYKNNVDIEKITKVNITLFPGIYIYDPDITKNDKNDTDDTIDKNNVIFKCVVI